MNFGIFVVSEILFAVALLGFNLVTARADWESTLAAAKKEGALNVIALPDDWAEGNVKGLQARGGFEVEMAWQNGKLTEATLRSKRGGACKIIYDQKTLELKTQAGKSYRLDAQLTLKR